MKLTSKILVIFVFIPALFDSCTKDISYLKYPDFKPRLVISGYLSPDEEIHYISVGFNQTIFVDHPEMPNLRKTTATLSDGNQEVHLRPLLKRGLSDLDSILTGFVFTSSELAVVAGKTYNLKVFAEDGLYAESSCTVPLKKDYSPKLDTVTVPYQNSPQYSYLQCDFSFTDIPGEENYYALYGEIIRYRTGTRPVRPEYTNLVEEKFSIFKDKAFDGERLKIRLKDITSIKGSDSAFLKIYHLNTDKPYYDYHESILNYVSGEIPFTEASPVYSNVTGGFGIFAAYTCDSILIRLK